MPAPPEPETLHVQPNEEGRPVEQSPPGAEARAVALQILIVHAMLVVLQVVALHGVHGPEHEHAHHEHHPLGRPPR